MNALSDAGHSWKLLEPLLLQRLAEDEAAGKPQHRALYGALRAAGAVLAAAAAARRCQVAAVHTLDGTMQKGGTTVAAEASDRGLAGGSSLPAAIEKEGMSPRPMQQGETAAAVAPQLPAAASAAEAAGASTALWEALPVLMWRYADWHRHAAAGQAAESRAAESPPQGQRTASPEPPSPAGTHVRDEAAGKPAMAAAADAECSPGLSLPLSLLRQLPQLLPGVLRTLGAAPLQPPALAGRHQSAAATKPPSSEGSTEASPEASPEVVQGRSLSSLALMQVRGIDIPAHTSQSEAVCSLIISRVSEFLLPESGRRAVS